MSEQSRLMEYRDAAEETVQTVVDAVPQDELTSEVVSISSVRYGDTFRAGHRPSDPAYWNADVFLALVDRPGVAEEMGHRIIDALEVQGWEARLDERISDEDLTKFAFSRPDLEGRWYAELYFSDATEGRVAKVSFMVITPYTTLGDYNEVEDILGDS